MQHDAHQHLWDTKLSPWLNVTEQERKRLAVRFYLTAIPGLIGGLIAGYFTLIGTGSLLLPLIAFGVLAIPVCWIGYRPLQNMQAEIESRARNEAHAAFGFSDLSDTDDGFDLTSFYELDILFDAPGEVLDLAKRTGVEHPFDMASVSLEVSAQQGRYINRVVTNFSGVLIRLPLKSKPASKFIITREPQWFSELSQNGLCHSANSMQLSELRLETEGSVFKIFAEREADPTSLVGQSLMAELMAFERRFAGRPLRIAVVPGSEGGMCYIAAHTRLGFTGFTILEPDSMVQSFNSLVGELGAVIDLVDTLSRKLTNP